MNDSQRDRYEAAKRLVHTVLTGLPVGSIDREVELREAIRTLESVVEDMIASTPQPQPETVPIYPPCVHCHVRHDTRLACRVLPDGAVLITTNWRA